MQISLTDFEIDLLNKFIHTQTFADLSEMELTVNETLNEQKSYLISSGMADNNGFDTFVTNTAQHITQFLLTEEFFHPREGGVYFLTEKGKHLRTQGSLQKYQEWESKRGQELLDDMHTIQAKGYLLREQPTTAELAPRPLDRERKSNWIYYVLIIIALIVFYLVGKNHKFS